MITEKWKTLTSVTQRSWSDQIPVRRTKVIEDFIQRIRVTKKAAKKYGFILNSNSEFDLLIFIKHQKCLRQKLTDRQSNLIILIKFYLMSHN